jgi:glycosyltransferase involved in cell wall biosynthesis
MRILYISQYFPPEVGATQTRAVEMATTLVSRGHSVTMLTEFPNHPHGIIPRQYRGKFRVVERYRGIDVVRSWVYARPQKTFVTRMGFYLSFMTTSILTGSVLSGRYDVVYATSPPFFVGVSGLLLSRIRNIPFVFEVRDLWPESAVELGELNNPRFIRWSEQLERQYYRRAARLIPVTTGIRNELEQRGYGDKVTLIPNGTNTRLFYNHGPVRRRELGDQNEFIVLYAGILGIAQGFESLCELAARYREDTGVRFVFIGDGPMKERILQLKQQQGLDRLSVMGQVPRETIPEYLSSADCCLVPLRRNRLFKGALPSKMFDYMACERPIVLSVDGEARRVLEESGGGLYAEPENVEAMSAAIDRLRAHPDLGREMGQNGRRFVEQRYSRRQQALQLERVLYNVI